MRVQSVGQNNSPNFGINVINKPSWNKELLKTLEQSSLVRDIDRTYPKATVAYSKHNVSGLDIANDEPNYLASLIFNLEKGKVSTLNINSHTSEGADRALSQYIGATTLENLEKNAKASAVLPLYSVEIRPVKKQNRISRLISKIFS